MQLEYFWLPNMSESANIIVMGNRVAPIPAEVPVPLLQPDFITLGVAMIVMIIFFCAFLDVPSGVGSIAFLVPLACYKSGKTLKDGLLPLPFAFALHTPKAKVAHSQKQRKISKKLNLRKFYHKNYKTSFAFASARWARDQRD